MEIRIAILGAGRWGENHIRTFWELLGPEKLIVCDPDEERLALMADRFPGLVTSPSPELALTDRDVEGVVIATPVSTHYCLAKEALTAGKHVLVEKPLALEVPEAEELVRLAEEKGLVLMVDHLLEHHPAVRKLRELISSRRLGRIYHISSERLNLGVIRTEENALWSLAPHDISVILYLLGEMPTEVAAQGAAFLQQGVEDVAFLAMRFPSGVIAHVRVSWLEPVKVRRMTVVGERAMAVFDDMAEPPLTLIEYRAMCRGRGSRWEVERGEPMGIEVEREEPLKLVAKAFLAAIEGRAKPLTDGRDGLRVLQVLSAAQRSMEQGGHPVPMPVKEPNEDEDRGGGVFIHETAYIDEGVEIGEGTKIWHFSHVMRGAKIGRNCTLGQNVFIGPNVRIGNNVKIQNNVSVYEGVTLEDDVFCGPSCVFTNVDRPRSAFPRDRSEYLKTVVKRGATIGANATIVCGHTLGEYCFVGAGAVVTKDVPPYALVYGNPARIHGWVCKCGQRLEFKDNKEATCTHCGRRYRREGEGIRPLEEGSS